MPPTAMTLKRIHREIADLAKEDLGSMTLAPSGDNLFLWKGQIPGPEGSVYEGGLFNMDVILAPDYPFTAPRVTFKTRIYHMNISERGDICIDILKNNWSPALSLFKVLLSLSSLLTDPNPRDPLVGAIANQFNTDRPLHDATARQWTHLYARPPPPPPPAPSSKVTTEKTQARGKAKATNGNLSASSSRSVPSETISVDSSDEEEGTSSRSGVRAAGTKRKRGSSREILDLDDDGVEVTEGRNRKKSATVGRGRNSERAAQSSEVIVIDD